MISAGIVGWRGMVGSVLMDRMREENEENQRRAEEEIQTITDKYIAEIDQTLAEKESELMEV